MAEALGLHVGTLSRYRKDPEFQKAEWLARAGAITDNEKVHNTLLAMLDAVTKDGFPDWQARASAARALISMNGKAKPPEPKPRETWYVDLPPEGADAPA